MGSLFLYCICGKKGKGAVVLATAKKTTTKRTKAKSVSENDLPKMTVGQYREKIKELQEKIDKFETTAFCPMCEKHKSRETGFYLNTDPMYGHNTITTICRDCARKIALRVDKNGEEHEPTKESVILALKYLNKPFKNIVWDASIQESENLIAGKVKHNVWTSYIKNIQMVQYVGETYFDSDFYKEKIVYDDEKTSKQIVEEHAGQDTYDSFVKNKEDVIRLLSYDPFDKESISDQPFLYSNLLGMLDTDGAEVNEDMIRTSSAITISRGFLQAQKIDDTIAKLMNDVAQLEKHSATIKSLQDSKKQIFTSIKDLAAESCLSLKNSKNTSKGENTWTGKIKKIRDLNLRDGQVNGFDINTCRGMKQVLELSDAAIFQQLHLDESEYSDMIAEMRQTNQMVSQELEHYKEINRILLQENIDLKDYLDEKGIDILDNIKDLKDLYSVFADTDDNANEVVDEEELIDEQDNSTS